MPYSRESYSEFPTGQNLTFTIWAVQVEQNLRDTYQTSLNNMFNPNDRNAQKRFVNQLYNNWQRGWSPEDTAYSLIEAPNVKRREYEHKNVQSTSQLLTPEDFE